MIKSKYMATVKT